MRIEKTQMVSDISAMLNEATFVFFVGYKGLTVKDFSDLRAELAKHEAECHVLKNRLIRKAAELEGINALSEYELKNDTAMVCGAGDAGVVAKVISDFFKAHEQVIPKVGLLDGELLSDADIKDIAALPSKEVLQSQLIGVIQAPTRNLVTVLDKKLSEIVNVINAYKDKLEGN